MSNQLTNLKSLLVNVAGMSRERVEAIMNSGLGAQIGRICANGWVTVSSADKDGKVKIRASADKSGLKPVAETASVASGLLRWQNAVLQMRKDSGLELEQLEDVRIPLPSSVADRLAEIAVETKA